MRIKASKREKITCLTFYAFYASEITPNNLISYNTMVNPTYLVRMLRLHSHQRCSQGYCTNIQHNPT